MRIAAFCVAALIGSAAAADDAPIDLSGTGVRGRLARIVKPEYPPDALARGLTGTVALEGVIRPDGFVEEFKYVPDKAESRVFVDALEKVTRNWIFHVPLDYECQPRAEPARVTVSFEIDNGTPRIFVEHASQAKGPAVPVQPYFRPTRRTQPEYPYYQLKIGLMANTYTRIVVDRDGNVTSVKARSYSPHRDAGELAAFDRSAERALATWKFPAVPEDAKAPWIGCYQINFRIRD
jgi:outer membrane biosynthesis protein TonB